MLSAVIDFPLPDSPTMPRVSPRRNENETPSTAFTSPILVSRWVSRFSTSRMVSPRVLPLTPG